MCTTEIHLIELNGGNVHHRRGKHAIKYRPDPVLKLSPSLGNRHEQQFKQTWRAVSALFDE